MFHTCDWGLDHRATAEGRTLARVCVRTGCVRLFMKLFYEF